MFSNFGYYKEYYLNGKYIGSIKTDKDRDVIGYNGRLNENIDSIIILDNKKKLKINTIYQTILYPLCGKIV